MLTLYRTPRVTLVSSPLFHEPTHMPVHFLGDASPGEQLAEFSGRLCYMSQHNPAERETAAYIENIKQQAHGSVLEHANYSLLVEQVSRSLTHEWVRHRAGWAYSQLSQRYVDESESAFVIPPAILGNTSLEQRFEASCAYDVDCYIELVEDLMGQYSHIDNKTERRKKAREAARSVLPNATETKLVATGNARAWRHFFTMRGALGADAEIRRLAFAAFEVLRRTAPSFFDDFESRELGGVHYLAPTYMKV
jgi:thymidylate synthase (FAD)